MLRDLGSWHWLASYSTAFVYLLAIALPMLAIDLYMEHSAEEYPTQRSSFAWQIAVASVAILFIAYGAAYQPSPFVYFQF
jgi:hypothetical protein